MNDNGQVDARDAFQMDDDAARSVRLAWFLRSIAFVRDCRVRTYRRSSAGL